MKIGVVYPQTEFGNDPAAIREFAQVSERLGFSHILAYDHVLGANPDRPEGWKGTYNSNHAFHEPFVLFSHMAAVTKTIEFTTGILILPQRQTGLVAKQAATLDVLSGGRLRMGFGVGWNPVEFIALNENFHNRGRRIEEQIHVLRTLWKQPLVTFSGKWHNIPDAGLNPLPIQRPIPIWLGGNADLVLKRTARLADGWMPNYRSAADAKPAIDRLTQYREEAKRLDIPFDIEARVLYGDGRPDAWLETIREWQACGVNYISINLMGSGFTKPSEFFEALRLISRESGLV